MDTYDETPPDETPPDEATIESTDAEFGEQDEAAQEAEWAEDAAEDGDPA